MKRTLGLLVGLGIVAGCGYSCTLIGCVDGLTLTLALSEPLAAGDYVLATDSDSGIESCGFTVGEGADCPQEEFAVDSCLMESECDMSYRLDGPDLVELVWTQQTDDDELFLTLDDATGVVFETTMSANYSSIQPNGDNCGPTCTFASEFVEVDL